MGKLSTTRLAFLAVAVAAAFPVLAQAADAATVDQGTLEKGFSQSTGGNSIFEDTNVALKLNNQVTVGTSLDTKGKIYLKGETDNISSLSIKSNSYSFRQQCRNHCQWFNHKSRRRSQSFFSLARWKLFADD